jgi:hypothetical protein
MLVCVQILPILNLGHIYVLRFGGRPILSPPLFWPFPQPESPIVMPRIDLGYAVYHDLIVDIYRMNHLGCPEVNSRRTKGACGRMAG